MSRSGARHLAYAPRTFALKLIWEVFTDLIGYVMTARYC